MTLYGSWSTGSLLHKISPARILECSHFLFQGILPTHGSNQVSPHGRFFISEPPGKPRREQNIPPALPVSGYWQVKTALLHQSGMFPNVMFSSLFVTAFQTNSLDSRDRWGGVGGDRVLTGTEGLGYLLCTDTHIYLHTHCEPGPSSQQSFLRQ